MKFYDWNTGHTVFGTWYFPVKASCSNSRATCVPFPIQNHDFPIEKLFLKLSISTTTTDILSLLGTVKSSPHQTVTQKLA
jgi:hypothetical protein